MKVAKSVGVILSVLIAVYSTVCIIMTDLSTIENCRSMILYLCLFIVSIFLYGVAINIYIVCKHSYAIAVVLCAFVYVLCRAIISGWRTTRRIHKRTGSYIQIYMSYCNKFSQEVSTPSKHYRGKYEGGK